MLQVKEGVCVLSRGGRAVVTALLVIAALAASAVRGPAQKTETPTCPVDGRAEVKGRYEDRPPFDLTYTDPDDHGVVAVRPAAIFTRPDAAMYRAAANRGLQELLDGVGKGKLDLGIEDIEQIVATLHFQTDKQAPRDRAQSSVELLAPMVRTTHDHDWGKTLHTLVPGLKESNVEGTPCLLMPKEVAVVFGGPVGCFCVLDKRTLLIGTEAQVRAALKRVKGRLAAPAWRDDWKRLDRGVLAVAVADIRATLADRRAAPEADEPGVTLLRSSRCLVFGVDIDTDMRWELASRSTTEADAERSLGALRAVLKSARERVDQKETKEQVPEAARRVIADMLTSGKMERTKTQVHAAGVSKGVDLPAFVGALMVLP